MATQSRGFGRTDFVFMLVALYFILISFFIIISTISVRDNEKLQAAVNSITHTFKVNDRIAVANKKTEPTSYTVFLNDLQSWIGNLYALGKVNIVRRGNQIVITIRHPRFFRAGTEDFTEASRKAMGGLADLLSTWQTEYLTELEIIAAEPAAASAQGESSTVTSAHHASLIASYLMQRGIAPQSMSIGVQENPDAQIDFTFIIRIPPKLGGEEKEG
jgi:hypothetical protein